MPIKFALVRWTRNKEYSRLRYLLFGGSWLNEWCIHVPVVTVRTGVNNSLAVPYTVSINCKSQP